MKETYVSFVSDKIYIDNVQSEYINDLKRIRAVQENNNSTSWIIDFCNEQDKSSIFSKLRDLGICFSAGKDWSPSEQFEDLRERGLILGKYKYIAWNKPNEFIVIEK